MAKNHNVQRIHHVIHVGKRITPQNGVGRVLEHTYDPRGTTKTIKPMMIPMRTKKPKMSNNSETSTSDQSTSKKPESKN